MHLLAHRSISVNLRVLETATTSGQYDDLERALPHADRNKLHQVLWVVCWFVSNDCQTNETKTRIITWSVCYASYGMLVPLHQAMGGVYLDHHSYSDERDLYISSSLGDGCHATSF